MRRAVAAGAILVLSSFSSFLESASAQICPYQSTNLPPGSFQKSCFNCKVNGGVLSCQNCGTGAVAPPFNVGQSQPTSIDICSCQDSNGNVAIWNDHGNLTCGPG